jgi:hypothetical protein
MEREHQTIFKVENTTKNSSRSNDNNIKEVEEQRQLELRVAMDIWMEEVQHLWQDAGQTGCASWSIARWGSLNSKLT